MKKMRNGFSLVTAIFFMVLVATIATLALSISATTAKHTTDIFLREQAELLAQSATEIAVSRILGTTTAVAPQPLSAANCYTLDANSRRIIQNEPFPDNRSPLFRVTVNVVSVIGNINGCGTAINTPTSAGTVVLDVFVDSVDRTNFPVRFHRRTIQKL